MSFYARLDVDPFDSNRTVLRAARKRLACSLVRLDPSTRDALKNLYREVLQHHREAREFVIDWRL